LHLDSQKLTSCPHGIVPSSFSPTLPVQDGLALEGGGTAVKYENRVDAEPEKFANAAEEADDVGVSQGVAFLVSDGLEELVDPDGGIYGKPLAIECCEVGRPRAGLHDLPESVYTHDGGFDVGLA
jgi:hypothetical protein